MGLIKDFRNKMFGRQNHDKMHSGPSRMVYRAPKGAIWNPLLKYPRNAPCVCKSGKKFKKCCLPNTPLCIKETTPEETKAFQAYIKSMRKIFHKGELPV